MQRRKDFLYTGLPCANSELAGSGVDERLCKVLVPFSHRRSQASWMIEPHGQCLPFTKGVQSRPLIDLDRIDRKRSTPARFASTGAITPGLLREKANQVRLKLADHFSKARASTIEVPRLGLLTPENLKRREVREGYALPKAPDLEHRRFTS